ncbi:MAG: fibrinogen-like YCDxxxxGGGW domain-containing protein, partial [Nannocystaceae bacterium]
MTTLDIYSAIVSSSTRVGLTLCALALGCGDLDERGGAGLGDGSTSADDGASGDDATGADDDGSGDGSGDSTGTPPEAGECGDGVIDPDEDCDDGINDGSYGTCNADCSLAALCGDALRNGVDETCDDGNMDSNDGCLADCSIPGSCEAIKEFDSDAADGLYIIDQDGEGGDEAIQVFCDMSALVTEWGEPESTPDGFGWYTAGADVAVGDVGAGAKPDMVLLHVDDPLGGNRAYYQIGWDLDESGSPTLGWSERTEIPGDFGIDGTGAGLSLADIDGDGSMDMVVTHIESQFLGDNRAYYQIGWNLNQQGQVTGGWSDRVQMPNDFGGDTAEAGAAMLDLDNDGRMDLISFHVRESFGRDEGYYQIGWGLDADEANVPDHDVTVLHTGFVTHDVKQLVTTRPDDL